MAGQNEAEDQAGATWAQISQDSDRQEPRTTIVSVPELTLGSTFQQLPQEAQSALPFQQQHEGSLKRKTDNTSEAADQEEKHDSTETTESKRLKPMPGKTGRRGPIEMLEVWKRKYNDETDYGQALRKLNLSTLPKDKLRILKDRQQEVPPMLFRAYSLRSGCRRETPYRCTNGYNAESRLEPAADTHAGYGSCVDISSIPFGPAQVILGRHLMWQDTKYDQFLSWTRSLLFAIEHALGRYDRGERDIYIAMADIRKLENDRGEKIEIFHALDLYEAFEVPCWDGWNDRDEIDLHGRKFTHEYLSHGPVVVTDAFCRHVPLQELVDKSMFEVFPEFDVAPQFQRTGLYTRLVALRRAWFPPPKLNLSASERLESVAPSDADANGQDEDEEIPSETASTGMNEVLYVRMAKEPEIYSYCLDTPQREFTNRTLSQCYDLALGFLREPKETEYLEMRAPLHAFLSFCALVKRPRRDEKFMAFIVKHYTRHDLAEILSDSLSQVPDNLPESMQYLDLVRDSCFALGVPRIPNNDVQHADRLTARRFEEDDACMQKHAKLYYILSEDELLSWADRLQKKGKQAEAVRISNQAAGRKQEEEKEKEQKKKDRQWKEYILRAVRKQVLKATTQQGPSGEPSSIDELNPDDSDDLDEPDNDEEEGEENQEKQEEGEENVMDQVGIGSDSDL